MGFVSIGFNVICYYTFGNKIAFLLSFVDPFSLKNKVTFTFQSIGPLGRCFLCVEMSVCVFVRVSVCSLFRYRLNVFLPPPPSQSRMSNIFRDSESLGKSSGKKWSHIWIFLFEKCLKSPHKIKVCFFGWFFLTKHGRNHTSRWIRDLWWKGILLILPYL